MWIARVIFLLPLLSSLCWARCPGPEWFPRRNSSYCYFMQRTSTLMKSWDNARKDCQGRGGQLADITDVGELDYIISKIPGGIPLLFDVDFWLSLSYANKTWVWADQGRLFQQGSLGEFDPMEDHYFAPASASAKPSYRGAIRYDTMGQVFITTARSSVLKNFICKAVHSNRPLCKTEEGWDYVNDRCWLTVPEMGDFNQAREYCFAQGGYIAVPSTADENLKLSRLATASNLRTVWIGLTLNKSQETNPNALTFDDGSMVIGRPYNAWKRNLNVLDLINGFESGHQYCGYLLSTSDFIPVWEWDIARACSETRAYSCESELEKCPYGWDHFGDFCYQIRGSDADIRDWESASVECGIQGGQLAIIRSPEVQHFLEARLALKGFTGNGNRNFHFGLKRELNSATFTWTESNGVSPPPGSYTNWPQGSQPALDGNRHCAYLRAWDSFKWYTDHCDSEVGFVCQAHYTNALVMDIVHAPLKCDPPFELFHDGCYFFSATGTGPSLPDTALSWDDAKRYCRSTLNSSLLQLHTAGENEYVRGRIAADTWIGVVRVDWGTSSRQFYFQNSQGVNISADAYTNFFDSPAVKTPMYYYMFNDKGDPNNDGKWKSADRTNTKPFVCYHRGDPFTSAPPEDDIDFPDSPECGPGWIYIAHSQSCIKIKFEAVTWARAADICQAEGPDSTMYYITGWDEQAYVQMGLGGSFPEFAHPQLASTSSYWTALKITSPTNFYWSYRGTLSTSWTLPMAFVDFKEGEPDPSLFSSILSPARCSFTSSDLNGKWSASSCEQVRATICKRPLPVDPSTITTPAPLQMNVTLGCPGNWTQVDDFCYYRNAVVSTWGDARSYCQSHGSKLAKLLSAGQMSAIKAVTGDGWIGLNSLERPGGVTEDGRSRQFFNDDGSRVLYTPWLNQIAHPNAAQKDFNCVAVSRSGIVAYDCNEKKTSTCMLPLIPLENLPSECMLPPHDPGCRKWGVAWRGSCLYMGNEPGAPLGLRKYVNFEEAERFCQQHYQARLVTINSESKQEFITSMLAEWAADYWIGLRGGANAYLYWQTGETVANVNWGHGEPNVQLGGTSCVAVHGARTELNLPGDWFLSSCDAQKFALCEAPREGYVPPTVGPTVYASGCPRGFTTVAGSPNCYKGFYAPPSSPGDNVVPVKLSWREAEDTCIGFRGHLASIEGPAEAAEILAQLPNKLNGYAYWIGLSEASEGVWKWSDGRPYGVSGQVPDGHGSTFLLDCVAMDAQSGLWIQQNCNLGWGWVCEVPKGFYHEGDEIPLISPPTTTNATCAGLFAGSGDWFYDPITDTCFMISKVPERWDDAESACNRVNAHLATVELQQHNFLAIILSRYASVGTRFWIGLRLVDPMTMMHSWVDRSLSMYRAWDTNEPATGGVQSCVSMKNTNGKWMDDFCQNPLRYVCAVSKRPIVTPSLPPPAADSWGCPATCPGCVPFRGFCYYFAPNTENYSWRGASVRCNQRIPATGGYHSDLVSIHDQIEQDFLLAELGRLGDGANRWIGLQGDQETKKFYWSDETPFDWQSGWQWSEPNSMFLQPECGMIYGTGNTARAGRWNDEQCEVTMPYICKIQKTDSSVPLPPPPPSSCKAGYEALGSACFAVVALPNGPSSWREARNYCQTQGTRMATILNPVENAFVHVCSS
ncbi:C-type mannose receptor 2 [Hypsibius exemplaris]|uniref:C-type mannose receptor 2 n=1 Tax=Hypsibius exemplaris TaxID=2072580 RepID=A0A1W0WD53_HYPEX|nr:C-type mannose receptor 2 [Hypsibius exemplaris]